MSVDTTVRVPAAGPLDARLVVVGMAPATDEVRLGAPFMGASGQMLNFGFRRHSFDRARAFITNVLEFPLPWKGKIADVDKAIVAIETERLRGELERVRPNCIFALGDEPFQILTGLKGIMKYRGSVLPCSLVPGLKVVSSPHPSWILQGNDKWEGVFVYLDMAKAIEESLTPGLDLPSLNMITGPSYETVMDYLDTIARHAEWVSFDLETMNAEIDCAGVGYKLDEALCIPFARDRAGAPYWHEDQETRVWRRLATVLQTIPVIAQNASFEWIYMWRHGIFPRTLYVDTMTLHHCLYPDFGNVEDIWRKRDALKSPGHSLAFINSQYTRIPYYKDDRKMWNKKDIGGLSNVRWWEYNCRDVIATAISALRMREEAEKAHLWEYYQRRYVKPFFPALRAEWAGILIDVDLRRKFLKEAKAVRDDIRAAVQREAGFDLQVTSPKQMAKFLYEVRGYPKRFHRKSGQVTADKDTLVELAHLHNDKTLEEIISLRQIMDFISDVLRQPLTTGNRIHTHFKFGGTKGTRWSSGKSILGNGTNLQNVPTARPRQNRAHEFLTRARALFLAD